ncbi:glycoside hydrolase family 2 protein [Apiospora marii]|uniref:Glycoside hydrolase family 2 protein n=1 Tax=Apiospora marii TaxID=335849 RepID=A0ABR1S8K8_9PEZI
MARVFHLTCSGGTAYGLALLSLLLLAVGVADADRTRLSLNQGWRFSRFESAPDGLSYDTLKPWILPSANDFINNGDHHERPGGTAPGSDVEYTKSSFDDGAWEAVDVPHDWAIKGPFGAPGISGGMGRLPSNGIGWYRRTVSLEEADVGKTIFLDIDGAMSHSAVWLNGELVGGWPFGYASFRLDLTPHLKVGDDNLLAIRLENKLDSSRWYPGAGIYRNIWLIKVDPVHVGQFGTYVTTPAVSAQAATVHLAVDVENKGNSSQEVEVATEVFVYNAASKQATGDAVATFPLSTIQVAAGARQSVNESTEVQNPALWGPLPTQKPNQYVAVTSVSKGNGTVVDKYQTPFGIRTVEYSANEGGILVNGEKAYIQGVCNHHDLGALGAAFNNRAAQRQLEMLQDMGVNALRTSHNPPAPELMELADSMGILVFDELFDAWAQAKVKNDYNTLFADWHEPDLRAFVRRDRNHPSVVVWSIGNEIPEQTSSAGARIATELMTLMHEEDPTRPATSAMNNAGPNTDFARALDVVSLNYQGEGHGDSWQSTFPGFHSAFPDKMIWTSESSSVLSTRGTYIYPVAGNSSAVVGRNNAGANYTSLEISAYELYGPSWGASPDKVFAMQDRHPYVAGEFVWTGFDYIGEPTPYDEEPDARSSYFGIIDLAGFRKDRFYLYQARWRPDVAQAHILPHWSWGAEREGKVTPVHVFSSGDEAELFVNGKSAGRVPRDPKQEYRFRWDDVVYAPGDLRVVAYKDGAPWAEDTKRTVGAAVGLNVTVDRAAIGATGEDLAFVSVAVVDARGDVVPEAANEITFSVGGSGSGAGDIVATDNGQPTDQTPFPSKTRKAFSGLALAIVKGKAGQAGEVVVEAKADGLEGGSVVIQVG